MLAAYSEARPVRRGGVCFVVGSLIMTVHQRAPRDTERVPPPPPPPEAFLDGFLDVTVHD